MTKTVHVLIHSTGKECWSGNESFQCYIQLTTFHEVNKRIDQPMEQDIHRDIQGEYHVPWFVPSDTQPTVPELPIGKINTPELL
jgi:hypothetical protein